MDESRFQRMEESLRRIESAVLGDERIGHKGLVKRVAEHATRIFRLESLVVWGTGAAAVIGMGYVVLRDFVGVK